MTYYKKCHTVTMASWMENSEAYSDKYRQKKQALLALPSSESSTKKKK